MPDHAWCVVGAVCRDHGLDNRTCIERCAPDTASGRYGKVGEKAGHDGGPCGSDGEAEHEDLLWDLRAPVVQHLGYQNEEVRIGCIVHGGGGVRKP